MLGAFSIASPYVFVVCHPGAQESTMGFFLTRKHYGIQKFRVLKKQFVCYLDGRVDGDNDKAFLKA